MRETDFIRQNEDKWTEFERLIQADSRDPEQLGELFIEITDDLSFSRTYYPNRSVRVYLNGLAQSVFQNIYRNRKSKVSPIRQFWTSTLPDTLWHVRRSMFWAAVVFLIAMAIGWVSSTFNEDFCAIILGDYYVEMTESNIANGDPFAVYKDENPVDMFFRIALNNIRISYLVFVLGIMAGFGAMWIILTNGIMFGAFMHFFASRDLLGEFWSVVMLHGTLELSMIVLAGAAGLALGRGLLYPGSYGRLQSLIIAARRGVQLMVPCTVFLLIAAFIESWITRHTEPELQFLRVVVVLVSAAIVVGYFVWYPRRRFQRGLIEHREDDHLQDERVPDINFAEIKGSGKIFTEVFYFYKKSFGLLARTALAAALIVAAGFGVLTSLETSWLYSYSDLNVVLEILWPWNEVGILFPLHRIPLMGIPLVFAGSLIFTATSFGFQRMRGKRPKVGLIWSNALVLAVLMILPWFMDDDLNALAFLIAVFLYPLLFTLYATSVADGKFILSSWNRTLALLRKGFGRMLGLFWVTLSVPWIMLFSASSYFWYLLYEIIQVFWMSSWLHADELALLIFVGFTACILALGVPLMLFGFHLFQPVLVEINEAQDLRERIAEIGFKSKAFGLEKE